MGVLNVTPDSFSDGSSVGSMKDGIFRVSIEKAMLRAETMITEGAQIVDIGGESTRPGANPVSVQEELDRVLPVVEAIIKTLDTHISIDTSCPEVMREACNTGAVLINDVRALKREGALVAAAASGAAICLMHTLGEPKIMQKAIHYKDVVSDILDFLNKRVQEAIGAGITRDKLVVDPGFGFGKTLKHNYTLLKELGKFRELELPILVGISRKSMIGLVLDKPANQRLAGSLAATTYALSNGASIIRTHDVAATLDVIKVHCALVSA